MTDIEQNPAVPDVVPSTVVEDVSEPLGKDFHDFMREENLGPKSLRTFEDIKRFFRYARAFLQAFPDCEVKCRGIEGGDSDSFQYLSVEFFADKQGIRDPSKLLVTCSLNYMLSPCRKDELVFHDMLESAAVPEIERWFNDTHDGTIRPYAGVV